MHTKIKKLSGSAFFESEKCIPGMSIPRAITSVQARTPSKVTI